MTTRRPDGLTVLPSDEAPADATLVADFTADLVDVGEHHLCPGCGEPIAIRAVMDGLSLLGLADRCMAVFGIGCSTAFSNNLDVEVLQALHGRAPSVATGVIRMRPELAVFTIQGDGDMVNEGLQEVIHTAARGENVTCILLNNGVFGETGGHMTATTVLGQRTQGAVYRRPGATQFGGQIGLVGDTRAGGPVARADPAQGLVADRLPARLRPCLRHQIAFNRRITAR